MELCLIRHAIAGDRGPHYPDDSLRPLTPEGKAKMRIAASGLAELFRPEIIITSPFVRARQTAAIVSEVCGPVEIRECVGLTNGDDADLLRMVNATGRGRVAAVGHEPYMSATFANLLTGDRDGLVALFKKGAAALLSGPEPLRPGGLALEWLLQPGALRAIAKD